MTPETPHGAERAEWLQRGIELFNRGEFFDAHEVLEDFWRSLLLPSASSSSLSLPHEASSGQPLRIHVQGMVQLAVAFHHASAGNLVGARSVLQRAVRNLGGAESSFPRIDLDRLRTELLLWQQYLDGCDESEKARRRDAPALPKIALRDEPASPHGGC